jgi:hypothetical protein
MSIPAENLRAVDIVTNLGWIETEGVDSSESWPSLA